MYRVLCAPPADVVWEALDSVDGDTQLVDAEFRPFRPHASQQAAQDRQAAAQDAEWAEVAAAAAASGGMCCQLRLKLGEEAWLMRLWSQPAQLE